MITKTQISARLLLLGLVAVMGQLNSTELTSQPTSFPTTEPDCSDGGKMICVRNGETGKQECYCSSDFDDARFGIVLFFESAIFLLAFILQQTLMDTPDWKRATALAGGIGAGLMVGLLTFPSLRDHLANTTSNSDHAVTQNAIQAIVPVAAVVTLLGIYATHTALNRGIEWIKSCQTTSPLNVALLENPVMSL